MSNKNLSNDSKRRSTLDPKVIINTFENLLQPPTDSEIQQLEDNILRDGEIRDPLVIWKDGEKNILIDGIIRHRIALKHKLVCPVVYYEFSSTEEVKVFVLTNQLGRRNLSDYYKCELVLHLEEYYKTLGRKNQSKGGSGCQISDKETIDTKKILGKKVDVSHDTIYKAKKISETVKDPEVLSELRQGKRSINSVYNTIKGENPKTEPIEQPLFNPFGGLIPDMSSLKSLKIVQTKEGLFKIEVITKKNEKQVYETVNQIVVTETKPTKVETDEKLLNVLYEDYDFDSISNPYWEDLRSLFIREVWKMNKYISLKMDEQSDYRVFIEKLRKELLKNWEQKNQPLGGGRKTSEKIIKELQVFKDIDPLEILISDDSGNNDVLKTGKRLTSGINQYFPEMLDTPTISKKSPMDVIKNSKPFVKFMERVIVNNGMYLFGKSIEHKNNLKNVA